MSDDQPNGDFAAMLEEYGSAQSIRLSIGDKVTAKAIHIGDSSVFFELSASQEAFIAKESLLDEDGNLAVAIGDTIEAFIVSFTGGIELSQRLGRDQMDVAMLEAAQQSQMPIEGLVTGTNKGGLEISVGRARGFCPISQADIEFVEDPQAFVGQTLQFIVREVKEGGRNILLSRRALLERERRVLAEKTLAELEVGQRLQGTVTRVVDFGAFVDLGGIDGLIPMGELSHTRVERAEDVLRKGDSVTVEVQRIEADPKRPGQMRIGLSLKATLPDPFDAHATELTEGGSVSGTVGGLESYGAFVDLFGGDIRGLIHVSELADRRIGHPKEIVNIGDEVTVRILGVDRDQRRVSLSLKAAGSGVAIAGHAPRVGNDVTGTVDRIERYGVFVKLTSGDSALLPAAESGTPQGTDLRKTFPVGTELKLRIIAIDERDRIKVSKQARDDAEERAVLNEYTGKQKSSGGFGTLGDLLKKKGF